MRVSLDDHSIARLGKGKAGSVVPLRCAIDEKPCPPRAPGLGRQLLGELKGGRRGADVDPGGERRDIQVERLRPERLDQAFVGVRPALVAGHVEAARPSRRIG